MNPAPKRSSLHIWAAIVCTIVVVVSIAVIESRRRQGPTTVPADPPPATSPAAPPVAQIIDSARALKLVTFTFDTRVDAQSISDRWYGDAVATVRAPVKYQYGVDLEELKPADLIFDEAGRRYVFIVPAPSRMAVEVDLKQLEQTLQTSGLRWRSANQKQLEEARSVLADRAQAMLLSEADQARLRDVSREQLSRLLQNVLGSQGGGAVFVEVRFAE